MSGLDIFALIILATLVLTVVVALVVLGGLPGKVARKRQHVQADAIAVAGWLGILTFGALWPLALIWAYTRVGVDEQEVQS
jgi:hypothetical protein